MSIYVCNYENCCKTFRRPYKLQNHYNLHIGIRPFKCTAAGCDKSYSTPSHLKRHAKCHIENQPAETIIYACTYKTCGATFKRLLNLQQHESLHSSEGSSPLYCEKCRLRFKTSALLSKHMERHEVVLKRKCRYCGMDFSGKKTQLLLRHEKTHTYLKCELCDKTFSNLKLLHRHLVSHESQFQCGHCGIILHKKNSLTCHIRSIHMGFVSPYVCEEEGCSKVFHYKRNLTKHYLTNHANAQFKCPITNCGRFLLHKKSYERHLVLHQQNLIKIKRKREKVDMALKLVEAVCD